MHVIAPIHTHDGLGIIPMESTVNRDYTLGESFKIWGVDLSGKAIKTTVNGKQVSDYENIVLKYKENIVLDIKS